MKRIYVKLIPCCKCLMIGLLGILFTINAKAQIINEGFEETEWKTGVGTGAGGSTSGQIVITSTAATSTMTYYTSSTSTATSLNTDPNSGTWWYSKATTSSDSKLAGKVHSASQSMKLSSSGYIVTPLTSSAVVSVTFWAALGSPMGVGIATDPNAGQPAYSSTTPTPANFTNFSTSFSNVITTMTSYSISFSGITSPVRIGFFNDGGSSTYIDDIIVTQPTGTPPSILTTTVVPGITNANVSATVTPGTLPLLASGIIWSTSPLAGNSTDTALLSKTWDHPSATGAFTDKIGPLTPSKTYYAESYVIGLDNSVYFGGIKSFTTNPVSVPTVGITLTSILSNKAGATGTIIDSGGQVITEKGFVYNKTGGATTASNLGKVYEGTGTLSFSDFVKGLSPNTHYCVRAYAVNASGPGYSPDTCFTTGNPSPTLTAIPGSIDFGQNFYGAGALILSYVLTGSDLSGAPITITAPPGFIIDTSVTAMSGILVSGNTITLTTANTAAYSGATLSPKVIYVELPTSNYGPFSGNVVHAGGGVTIAANADIVALTGSVVQSPIDVSNSGTDFWLGFAFEHNMKQKLGAPYPPFSGNGSNMYVYISGAPNTQVTVEMPLLSTPFSQTVTINAQGWAQVTGLPQGDPTDQTDGAGLPDARLYYTGVTNRGIHVYSHSGPIAVWLYDYATDNTAGGSLIFPTNTWNSSYTVQAFGENTNTGPPNSFFFVIADQDNTPVYFTPTAAIADSTTCAAFSANAAVVKYAAGVTDTVYLNRGQIFNAMGVVNGGQTGTGVDLSGTYVRTDCDKKIAVFGGNGRCLVSTPVSCVGPGSGSDNMVQQMTPSVAWDTKYFTVPTKSMARNLFRIYVKDPTTKVWINDTTHSIANNLLTTTKTSIPALSQISNVNGTYTFTAYPGGGFYSIESSAPMDIESDQPISITQFITSCSGNTTVGNNGGGDPEMIILTGAQQAITSATVYSPMIQDGSTGGAYINIVIPHAGVSTFKLDNLATVDTGSNSFTGAAYGAAAAVSYVNAFKPYPSDTGYYYATFHVGNGTVGAVHTMSSAVPFNGIAYGVAGGESYGFNAGTQVKDLNSVEFSNNPKGKDSSATAVRTCVGNLVTLQIALPYNPVQVDSLIWDPQGNPVISPNNPIKGAISAGKAKYDSTIIVDGRTFYVYTSPTPYTFSQLGTYRIPIEVYGTFASDCPGESIENMIVIVGHDQSNLAFQASCGNPVVSFTADTIPMAGTNIVKWIWDFGDNTSAIDGALDTSHTYPANQQYTAKITTYNSVGCTSTDSVLVDFSGGLKAAYTESSNAVCSGGSITFTDNSTSSGVSGHAVKWKWDFGDGSPVDSVTGTVISHTFTKTGKLAVKLTVVTDVGCVDLFIDSVTIESTPVAAFTASEACFGNSTSFNNQSTVPGGLGTIDSCFWDFGDAVKDTTTGTSGVSHSYSTAGTYTATLFVKSDGGCPSAIVSQTVTVDALPTAGFKLSVDCSTQLITFTDTSNANGGTISEWDWNFGDGLDTVTTSSAPFVHFYANGNGKSFVVTLTVKTKNGCVNSAAPQTFSIGAAPVAQFVLAPGTLCLPNAMVTFNNTSSISDGTTNNMYYIWHFGDSSPDSTVSPGAPAPVSHVYNTTGPYTVTLTAFSNKGCTNTTSLVLNTINPQPVATISPNPASTCLTDSLILSANNATVYNWTFGDGIGTSNIETPKYKWNAPGKYGVTLVITAATGCQSAPAVDSVTVNALPVANFTLQSTPICQASSISFTDASTTPAGSNIVEWDWDFGDGTTGVVKAPSTVGDITHTYTTAGNFAVTLTVKNSNGCVSILPYNLSIVVNPLPKPDFTVSTICLPGTAQFTDQSTVPFAGSISEETWDFGDHSGTGTGAAPTYTYATGGIYPVTLTVTSTAGCMHDTVKNITAYNIPTAKDSVENSSNLCSSQPVTVINQSYVNGYGNISQVQIFWDFANNPSLDTTDNAPVANGTYKHQYPVLATNQQYEVIISALSGNGCPGTSDTTNITVLASPNAVFNQPPAVCADATPFSLAPYASDQNNLGGLSWFEGTGVEPDSVTFSPELAGAGTHTLIFTSTNGGCSDTAMQNILVNPIPSVNYGPTVSVLEGDSALLAPVSVSAPNLQYMWSPSVYLDSDTSSSPTSKPGSDITYTITVTSGLGCSSSTTLLVQILKDFDVPNTFTPNGDGINDKWVIQNLSKYPIQWVQVFDRYGQLLFESHDYSQPWDGTYKGKILPAGTYYYIIELNGLRNPKTGYVTILK